MISGKQLFDNYVAFLNEANWKYEIVDETKLVYTAHGDDMPMDFLVKVDDERQTMAFISYLPVTFNEDKFIDGLLCVNAASSGLRYGKFFLANDGRVGYELTTLFIGSDITKEGFAHLMLAAHNIVDQYNEGFLAVAKGMISSEKFIEEA